MCFNLQKLLIILTKFFVNKHVMICFKSYPIATTSNPTFTNANINIINNKKRKTLWIFKETSLICSLYAKFKSETKTPTSQFIGLATLTLKSK